MLFFLSQQLLFYCNAGAWPCSILRRLPSFYPRAWWANSAPNALSTGCWRGYLLSTSSHFCKLTWFAYYICIHNFYTLQRKFVRLSLDDREATYTTFRTWVGSPSISEEQWAPLMGEDESFDYASKGVGWEVVSGAEIPFEDEEVTGVTADDEHTS